MKFNDKEMKIKSFHKINLKQEFLTNPDKVFSKVEEEFIKIEKHPGYIAIFDLEENFDKLTNHVVKSKVYSQEFRANWDAGWHIIPVFHNVFNDVDALGAEFIHLKSYNDKDLLSYMVYYANGTQVRLI